MISKDTIRRRCGYGLLYEVSRFRKKNAPGDAFFREKIEHIRTSFPRENITVKGSMGGALPGMGKCNARLNAAALKAARIIEPIQIGSDKDSCEPFNVSKHLTSDYIKKKPGVQDTIT